MAKKQKSFADKASGSSDKDAVYVKYVNSVRSEKTGHWRFNEQILKTRKGESLDVALNRLNEAANLVDIDLSEFEKIPAESNNKAEKQEEVVKAEKQEEAVKAEKQEEAVKAEKQEEAVKAEKQEKVVKAEKAKKEDK